MSIVKTRVQGGRVEFTAPIDWPEGVEIEARLVGNIDDDDLMNPQEIERTLKAMKATESLELTSEELSQFEERIMERKRREKAEVAQRLDKLKKGWES